MRKILFLLLVAISFNTVAQNYGTHWNKKDPATYAYVSLTFDANKAFGLKDNPRTEVDNRGFDWDFEVGARDRHVGVYLFYGRFDAIKYQTYGVGVDYYFQWLRDTKVLLFDGIEFSAGIYQASILRQDSDGNWGNFLTWVNPKARTIFWIGDVGIELAYKYQYRPKLGKAISEGSIGAQWKFDL